HRRARHARRPVPDAGGHSRRAAVPHQARTALAVRPCAAGLAVRPAVADTTAAMGRQPGVLPQAGHHARTLLLPVGAAEAATGSRLRLDVAASAAPTGNAKAARLSATTG